MYEQELENNNSHSGRRIYFLVGESDMKKILLAGFFLGFLAGCSTTYQAYEGTAQNRAGQGGTRITVDGVDIWENGDPPRQYQIIGYIDDQRGGGGFSKSMRNSAVVAKVKEVKGDAAIFLNSNSQITGMVSTGSAQAYGNTAFGTGFAVPASQMTSKYMVIKYIQ